MTFLALGIVALVAWFVWRRLNEVFCVSIRDGKVLLVRGRAPQRLVNEMTAVLRLGKVRRGTIRGVKSERGVRLACSGLDDGTEQRLRNVLGTMPISQLRAAPPIARPTFGQVLGIAWLAWMFDRR